jgi:hypothetical protein
MYEMYVDSNGLLHERTARLLARWINAYRLTLNAPCLIRDEIATVRRVIADLSRELDEGEADGARPG